MRRARAPWRAPKAATCASEVDEGEQLAAVLGARFAVDRCDGVDERLVLRRRQLDDLAARLPDRGHRVLFLLDVQLALEGDGVPNGGAQLLLHRARPGIVRRAVKE